MKHYYRSPKTTQELRANQENWHRAKRGKNLMSDIYWEFPAVHHDNCWKNKRKTQYCREKDFTKRSIILEYKYLNEWYLTEYFEENKIPFTTEDIIVREFVEVGRFFGDPRYAVEINGIIKYGYIWRKILGTKVTWWYNKDIGLKYLLKQIRNTRIKLY